tara:strand:- start:487 stop:2106 length:1620 start_codon:yes stop_codon:yes gene_type:complete
MFKKYITITYLLFIWACGTQVSQIDMSALSDDNKEKEQASSSQFVDNTQAIQFFMDGLMFMEQGDYSRAIIEFQDAIEMGSLSSEIYYSISECYWMIQKYNKSLQYGLLAIDYDDNNRDYSVSLGKKYISLNELEKALDIFIEISEKYEDNADVLFIIGDLKAELNDIDSALVYYQQAYNKDNSLILALEVAAELSLRSNHRYSKTILKKLLLADPSNPRYLQLFIEALPESNNLDDIEDLVSNEDIKSNPFINNLYNQLGYEYLMNRSLDKAESYFQKSLAVNDNDRFALYYLSNIYRDLEKYDESITVADKHILLYPKEREGYINKIISLLTLKNYQTAIEVSLESLSIFPNDFDINYFLGIAYYSAEKFIEAELYYEKSLKIDNNSVAAMHGLAMAYDKNKKWEKSDQLYIDLIANNTQDAQAYNNYAYSLVERNEEIDYALTLAEKAIQLSPKTSAYLDTVGWIYFKLGNFEKAKEFIAQSIVYDGSSAVVLEHYGDVLIALEEKDEALVFYKKALELDQDNSVLSEKISSYENQ